MTSDRSYEFEVALSFAGEDRSYASKLANILRRRGVNVFFDEYERTTLWGENLYTHLSEVYQVKARYCVMFISQHYATKLWTNHEREAAQARAFLEHEEYILPVRLDDTQIPGIPPTIGYLSWPPETAKSIADAVVMKLGKISSSKKRKSSRANSEDLIKYHTEMLEAYEQAIQLDPKDAYTYILKGEALYELERREEALAAFEKANQLDAENLSIYMSIGQVLSDLGRNEEALDAYNHYLKHAPNDAYVQGCKSMVLADLDRNEEALVASEQSLQLDPDDAIMQGHKAMMLYILNRSEEALAAYERAIQLDSTLDWLHQSKGDVLYDLDRYEEALAAYEIAIQLDHNYFTAHKGKGNVLYELKRYREALAAYNRAIQLNPKDADVYVRKGDTLKRILEGRKKVKKIPKKPVSATLVTAQTTAQVTNTEEVIITNFEAGNNVQDTATLTVHEVAEAWENIRKRTKQKSAVLAAYMSFYKIIGVEGSTEHPVVVIQTEKLAHFKYVKEESRYKDLEWALEMEFGIPCSVRLLSPDVIPQLQPIKNMEQETESNENNVTTLTVHEVTEAWENIRKRIKQRSGMLAAYLSYFEVINIEVAEWQPVIVIQAEKLAHYKYLKDEERYKDLEWSLTEEFGVPCKVRLIQPER